MPFGEVRRRQGEVDVCIEFGVERDSFLGIE